MAPFLLAAALLSQAPLPWPWPALLLFPALGLLSRWSDTSSGDSHDP